MYFKRHIFDYRNYNSNIIEMEKKIVSKCNFFIHVLNYIFYKLFLNFYN